MSASITILAGSSIGQISAEADEEFLFKCFIDHPVLSDVRDLTSPKMILLGSTGAGKTALLKMVEKLEDRTHSVELDELSLSYISNSNVISFLTELGVPLDHFFQALWKHVICVEYIKLRYGVTSEQRSTSWFAGLKGRFFGDGTKQRALKYLEKWEGKFWISVDETVREITENLEKDISLAFGAEIEKYSGDAGYIRKLGQERKSHLIQRLKGYVDANLLSELSQVIKLLAEYDENGQSAHYVLVDKLDENWVGDSVKYKLIRSLIEALKSMRKIRGLKTIVALRSDLMEKVVQETKEDGFQSEKYEDYIARIVWTSAQLKDLINKRVNYLFRRKYTKENVFFEDIFPTQINKEKPLSFILDRTLLRPRDAITFINFCLGQSAGKVAVIQSTALAAEKIYSTNRMDALVDEWRPIFPAIEPCLKMLEGRSRFFPLSELCTSKFSDTLFESLFSEEKYQRDPIFRFTDQVLTAGGDARVFELVQILIERLHLTGVIGVNTSPHQPIHWFYKTNRRIGISTLTSSSKVRIHPMLFSALGTN